MEPTCHAAHMDTLLSSERKIHSCLGDGNCLFRSFSKELLSSETHHLRVRTLLTDAVKWNAKFFSGYLTPPLTGKSVMEHVERMQKEFTWGTHIEIFAMASVLQVPIYLYTKKTESMNAEYYRQVFKPLLINTGFLLREAEMSVISAPSDYHIELLHSSSTHFDLIIQRNYNCTCNLYNYDHLFCIHLKDYKYVHEAKKTLCQYLSHRRHHAAIRPSFGRGWIHSTLCIYDRVSNARCVHCTYEMNTHTRHMTRGCGLTDRCESSPSPTR